jgi:predicted PurR-regulated permease PerM
MDQKTLSGYFLFVLIAITTLLAVLIFMPFLAPLSLAAAFAVVLHPLYQRMLMLVPGKPNLAASLVLIICLIGIVLPLALVLYLVGKEATKLYIAAGYTRPGVF